MNNEMSIFDKDKAGKRVIDGFTVSPDFNQYENRIWINICLKPKREMVEKADEKFNEMSEAVTNEESEGGYEQEIDDDLVTTDEEPMQSRNNARIAAVNEVLDLNENIQDVGELQTTFSELLQNFWSTLMLASESIYMKMLAFREWLELKISRQNQL